MVDILLGHNNPNTKSYGHDTLDVFGKGKGKEKQFWTSVFRQALLNEFLEKDIDNYGILRVNDAGKAYLEAPHSISFFKDHEYPNVSEEAVEAFDHHTEDSHDQELLQELKNIRTKLALEKDLPPYVIFQDQSLEEMATTFPTTLEDLTHIQGVGMGKAKKFGESFLEAIKTHVEVNDISSVHEVFVKTAVNKSKNKVLIIHQIDKQIPLDEIANSLGISYQALLEEMEHICHAGTKLDINYHLEEVVDVDVEDEIYNYFMDVESDDIEDAMDELGEDYSEEEIKLIHIKFISEVAN